MHGIIKLILALMLSLFGAGAMAAELSKVALAAALMQQSGMNTQIDLISDQVKRDIRESARQGLPMDVVIQDKLVGSLDTQLLTHDVQNYLAGHMTVDEMRLVLAWLESPLGKQVVMMEVNASQAEVMAEMFKAFQIERMRPGRMERIHRLDEAVLSKERTKDLMVNMQVFFGMAMVAESGSAQSASYGQIRHKMEREMAPMWGELEQVVTMIYLFTYQGLDDADLDRYLEFSESAHGRKYNQMLVDGLSHAFAHAGKMLRQSLKSACRTRQVGCDGIHPYPLV